MTGYKSLMGNFVEKDGHMVMFGDNNKKWNKGFGLTQYKTMEFRGLSCVKGLRNNLISINQLCNVGYKVYFCKEEGNINDSKNSIFLTAISKNKIFVLDVLTV